MVPPYDERFQTKLQAVADINLRIVIHSGYQGRDQVRTLGL